MRTGVATSTSAPRAQVGAALSSMQHALNDLTKQHAQCGVWAKLLAHGGVEQVRAGAHAWVRAFLMLFYLNTHVCWCMAFLGSAQVMP